LFLDKIGSIQHSSDIPSDLVTLKAHLYHHQNTTVHLAELKPMMCARAVSPMQKMSSE